MRGVKDAALIAAAQRVEHYEIAGYGTVRTLAEHLGHQEVAKTLQRTLDEEAACDKKLTKIAESSVNVGAARINIVTEARESLTRFPKAGAWPPG